ncbi:alpha/beta hydrolase fold domain-containing protein [Nitrosospira sp. Is2]|nr:alpha/beta hydrolase fold domain-containing protein [Nitrosospira sp. Is2]WON75137.1 alpha/beta hydrolase fold domain-containing protein [Nitrosospira sp. Is2]
MESDILCDEGKEYRRKLDEAESKVTTVRYDGMVHDFELLNAFRKNRGSV